MANAVSIRIIFETAELAEQALVIAERMIKLFYVPKELPWADEADQVPSLCRRYFRFGEEAAKLDPLTAHPYCALKWLRQDGTQVILERCADIQSPVDFFFPRDYFTQLCLTLSKRFPDTCFYAFCRHEETVSATVQLNRIISDHGKLVCYEMWSLDEEIDEDDWSRASRFILHENEGIIDIQRK